MQATYLNDGHTIDYTPSADVDAGDVIVLGLLVLIARLDIAADELGALWLSGRYTAVKDDSVMTAGCKVYWDADGDPVGGTAGSGAFSALPLGPFAGYNGPSAASDTAETFELYLGAENEPGVQTVTADDAEVEGLNVIRPGVKKVYVDAVTNGANDFVTLPPLAAYENGDRICMVAQAGANFEVRTPATSGEEINSEDCDGTKEYLFTDTQIHYFVKIDNTIGWMGHGFSAIGAVVTAVVPD